MTEFEIPGDWIWHEREELLRIATPPDWRVVDAATLGVDGVILAVAAPFEDDDLFVTNINFVNGRVAADGESLDQYAKNEAAELAKSLEDFQLIDKQSFEQGGREWSELLGAYQGREEALTLVQRTTLAPDAPSVIVTATVDTNQWPVEEGLITAILATVEVESAA